MYSFPSASWIRLPHASTKYSGTGAFALNGLLTPPASDRRARCKYSRDLLHLSGITMVALWPAHITQERSCQLQVRRYEEDVGVVLLTEGAL